MDFDRISNALVELRFNAKCAAWRPAHDPTDPLSNEPDKRDTARRLELTSSQLLRGLMGLTDAFTPELTKRLDDAIAAGVLVKHEPDAEGWCWLVPPTE